MTNREYAQSLLDEKKALYLNKQGPVVTDRNGKIIQYNVDGTVYGYWETLADGVTRSNLVCTNGDYERSAEISRIVYDLGFNWDSSGSNAYIAMDQKEVSERYYAAHPTITTPDGTGIITVSGQTTGTKGTGDENPVSKKTSEQVNSPVSASTTVTPDGSGVKTVTLQSDPVVVTTGVEKIHEFSLPKTTNDFPLIPVIIGIVILLILLK